MLLKVVSPVFSNLSEREKRLLYLLGAVLVLFVAYQLVNGLLIPKYKQLSQELAVAEMQLARAEAEEGNMAAMTRELEASRRANREARRLFDQNLLDGSVYLNLESLAAGGLAWTVIEPQPVERKETHLELPVVMGFTGDYPATSAFLENLENQETLVKIKEMEITGSENEDVLQTRLYAIFYGALDLPLAELPGPNPSLADPFALPSWVRPPAESGAGQDDTALEPGYEPPAAGQEPQAPEAPGEPAAPAETPQYIYGDFYEFPYRIPPPGDPS